MKINVPSPLSCHHPSRLFSTPPHTHRPVRSPVCGGQPRGGSVREACVCGLLGHKLWHRLPCSPTVLGRSSAQAASGSLKILNGSINSSFPANWYLLSPDHGLGHWSPACVCVQSVLPAPQPGQPILKADLNDSCPEWEALVFCITFKVKPYSLARLRQGLPSPGPS